MKYVVLVCEGLADEPVEELGGRTPLEIAKTPNLNLLVKRARLGRAQFVPKTLKPTTDVAAFSILGYDPEEFYTGIAPLDALSLDLPLDDREIVFRCDFVTTLDDKLVDPKAEQIASRQAQILLESLAAEIADPRFKFYPVNGYKNLLVIQDSELSENLDDLETLSPKECQKQKIQKCLPKGKAAFLILDLMERAKAILENHEINRVRIDLKENPANLIWCWGQGKRPALPSFKQRFGFSGGLWSNADFARGLARAAGLTLYKDVESLVSSSENFSVFYSVHTQDENIRLDLKTKVRRIEDFDHEVVKNVCKTLESEKDWRVLVTSDLPASLKKGAHHHGEVPWMIAGGNSLSESGAERFSEKNCAASTHVFEKGAALMESFLKS